MAKIFLSYAHIDLGFAKKIFSDLKQYGLDIWFDKESLLPGQDWEKEINKAIRESDYFIALLSDNCLSKRGFVHSELKLSFEIVERYFPSDSGIFILPVRLDECKPSDAYERLGRLHWIDIFPESEYHNGLKRILKVVSPGTFLLRNNPKELSAIDVNDMILRHGFYECDRNPGGMGFNHNFELEEIKDDKIIFDRATCLMWQQSGSSEDMNYERAKEYITELNQKKYAGYHDWRLPTLEEAMSLMEPEKKEGLYIDPVFDSKQEWIWTADLVKGESGAAWVVYFNYGFCFTDPFNYDSYVRSVRSGQSSTE